MWGGADYERIAQRFAPVHDELVGRVEPAAGERWLDVGTGTGEVALRAARAGADVTAVDISEELLELARAKDDAEKVRWELGDAQALRFDNGAFDVVASCFAVIFAPDQGAAAAELGRVCRSGGRLALTTWRPHQGLHAIYERFAPSDEPYTADEWGEEARVQELLGPTFELEFEERVFHLTTESPEAAWELMTEGAPPVKAMVSMLEPAKRAEFRQAMLARWEGLRTANGVDDPRAFLLVTGQRR
jgi:ubiquinone/menaquinone biosynthesis C-methylase UbiE